MKLIAVAVFLAMVAFAQAVTLSWLTVMPLLMSVNKPVEGFFNLFRRRQPPPIPPVRQTPQMPPMRDSPAGPVRFSVPNFSPQGASNFYNPFGSGSNGFFPAFQNPQSFPGGFQGNQFKPQQPVQQSWLSSNRDNPPQSQQQQFQSMEQNFDPENFESQQQGDERDVRFDDQPPSINTEEAESFFTLLAETDENKCISRLVCEMGADPGSAGDLGQTVNEIIGSLTDFPPGSKVSEYNDILTKGRSHGLSSCVSQYSSCDEETYNLMKSNQPE